VDAGGQCERARRATDELTNTNLNATDMIELEYIGYGFRLHARTANNLGIFSVQTQLNGAVEVGQRTSTSTPPARSPRRRSSPRRT
jgi:hypothetical protein